MAKDDANGNGYSGDVELSNSLPELVIRADDVEVDMKYDDDNNSNNSGAIEVAKQIPAAYEAKADDWIEAQRSHSKELEESPHTGRNKWSGLTVDELLKQYEVDPKTGLSTKEVEERQEKYGLNELAKEKRDSFLKLFLQQFTSAVVCLLLAAAIACAVVGDIVETVLILIIVNFNAFLAAMSEKNAGDALEKLAAMGAPKCTVIRDGEPVEIDSIQVVPGDVLIVSTGMAVPADARLFETVEIAANEAVLTGESEEVNKVLTVEDLDEPFAKNMIFMSSQINSGKGKAIITTTGMETQVGHIASHLKSEGNHQTPLQQALNRLGGMIGAFSICVLIMVVIIAVVRDYQDPSHQASSKLLGIIIIAVGFAVSSIPEGLPMVVTICLSFGCRDLVRKNAQIRKLPAVETLGCCSVICSDKTGTLTEGKMTAMQIHTFARKMSNDKDKQCYHYFPTHGFDPNGSIFKAEDMTDSNKDELDVQYKKKDFQDYSTTFQNHGDPGADCHQDADSRVVRIFNSAAYLNSHSTTLKFDTEEKKWCPMGNMSEAAIIVAAGKARIGTAHESWTNISTLYPFLDKLEVPFSSARKMCVSVHKCDQDNMEGLDLGGAKHFAVIKGAPDRIIKNSTINVPEWDSSSHRIKIGGAASDEDKKNFDEANLEMAKGALRVIMVGVQALSDADIQKLENIATAEERMQWFLSRSTCMLGLIGVLDPPRTGVREAVRRAHEAGIRVIMITGDQQNTAAAIAKDIGILKPHHTMERNTVACGVMHDQNNDFIEQDKIDELVKCVNVFSRAQPEDKIAIVHSLQRNGACVGMTGDGVNDAPALKAADIGCAMGISGTDVAKGASDMVLMDDNFVTIVDAVEEGRKIYANIQKFVSFLLGTNIGEVIYLAMSIILNMPVPLLALQIMFLNLMSDGCPAVALSREPADGAIMKQRPRSKKANIMTRDWWIYGNLPHCFFEAACVLACWVTVLYMNTGEWQLNPNINELCMDYSNDGLTHGIPVYCTCPYYDMGAGTWTTTVQWLDTTSQSFVTEKLDGKIDRADAFTAVQSSLTELHPQYSPADVRKEQDALYRDGKGYAPIQAAKLVDFIHINGTLNVKYDADTNQLTNWPPGEAANTVITSVNYTANCTNLSFDDCATNIDKCVLVNETFEAYVNQGCYYKDTTTGWPWIPVADKNETTYAADYDIYLESLFSWSNNTITNWNDFYEESVYIIDTYPTQCSGDKSGQTVPCNVANMTGIWEDGCKAEYTTVARSTVFITAVFCEMFRAYTVRCAPGTGLDPLWMWEAFNRNFVLHIACLISFTLTLAVVFTPVVNSAFHLTPIPFIAVVYATSFALLNMVLDELVPKPIYKRKIRRELARLHQQELKANSNPELRAQADGEKGVEY